MHSAIDSLTNGFVNIFSVTKIFYQLGYIKQYLIFFFFKERSELDIKTRRVLQIALLSSFCIFCFAIQNVLLVSFYIWGHKALWFIHNTTTNNPCISYWVRECIQATMSSFNNWLFYNFIRGFVILVYVGIIRIFMWIRY
jgi:hypothetical protein